jgi:hypothetical protein
MVLPLSVASPRDDSIPLTAEKLNRRDYAQHASATATMAARAASMSKLAGIGGAGGPALARGGLIHEYGIHTGSPQSF